MSKQATLKSFLGKRAREDKPATESNAMSKAENGRGKAKTQAAKGEDEVLLAAAAVSAAESKAEVKAGSEAISNSSMRDTDAPAAAGGGAAAAAGGGAAAGTKAEASYDKLEALVPASWRAALEPEFSKPYWAALKASLKKKAAAGEQIFPPVDKIFAALEQTPLDTVKVVIIGQDPYHDVGQAEGLCFSVQMGVKTPPSLVNMYKELTTDVTGFVTPKHGHLGNWAKQGVLLLNTVLTVKAHAAASHKDVGWQHFTAAVIAAVASKKNNVAWLLWGKFAEDRAKGVSAAKHLLLRAAHPSPLSAHNGFFGCKHFSKTNDYLKGKGIAPVDWKL